MHTQTFQLVEPVAPTDHAKGPQDAPVTLVEYGDFQCPSCKQASGALKMLFARFEQQVRFVFRHFPLEEIHPHALHAAEAAECAGGQGKFWEMHDVLFENQEHLKLRQIYRYATTLGLDMARFTTEMDREIHLPHVREHQLSGERSGARGTPTFFVNGHIVDTSFGLDSLFKAVENELLSSSNAVPNTHSIA